MQCSPGMYKALDSVPSTAKNLIWCHMLLKIKDEKFNGILCYKMSLRPVWKTGGRKRGND